MSDVIKFLEDIDLLVDHKTYSNSQANLTKEALEQTVKLLLEEEKKWKVIHSYEIKREFSRISITGVCS